MILSIALRSVLVLGLTTVCASNSRANAGELTGEVIKIKCSSEKHNLELNIFEKEGLATAVLSNKTPDDAISATTVRGLLASDFLDSLKGGHDWQLKLTNDIMENVSITHDHYEGEIRFNAFNGRETTGKFILDQCSGI